MTVDASPHRTSAYTEVRRCPTCSRAYWGKREWNAVTVRCPHCHSTR